MKKNERKGRKLRKSKKKARNDEIRRLTKTKKGESDKNERKQGKAKRKDENDQKRRKIWTK